MRKDIHICNTDSSGRGLLQVDVVSLANNFPIPGADVRVSYAGEPERTLQETTTDSSGQTQPITLETPPRVISR